jgi:hypothetical protein
MGEGARQQVAIAKIMTEALLQLRLSLFLYIGAHVGLWATCLKAA